MPPAYFISMLFAAAEMPACAGYFRCQLYRDEPLRRHSADTPPLRLCRRHDYAIFRYAARALRERYAIFCMPLPRQLLIQAAAVYQIIFALLCQRYYGVSASARAYHARERYDDAMF